MNATVPHLHINRYHAFYCRRAVPRDLRPILGCREIKRSLGRIPREQALRYVRLFSYQTEALFMHLRNNKTKTSASAAMGLIVKGLHRKPDGSWQVDHLETDPTADPETERAYLDQILNGSTTLAGTTPTRSEATPPRAFLLSDLVEAYCHEKLREDSWQGKTENENRAIYKLLIDILGDLDCASFTQENANSAKDVLKRLPAHIQTAKAYRGRSLTAILADEPHPMSVTSVNKYLGRYSALFHWASRHGYVNANYFEGLTLRNGSKTSVQREAFTPEDLQTIFSQSPFTDLRYKHPYYYWLPLLALYTGARINELCQLHIADIDDRSATPFISINNDASDKRLKTPSAARNVPLHPCLVELGFLAYVQTLRARGELRLFPELPEGRDGYSKNASRWFNEPFLRKCGIKRPGTCFHSFRHTVATRLKHASVPEDQAQAILGHANPSMTYGHYGQDYPIETLRTAIEALDYGDVLDTVQPFP